MQYTEKWRWLSQETPREGQVILMKRKVDDTLWVDVCKRTGNDITRLFDQKAMGYNIRVGWLADNIAWKPISITFLDGWPDEEERKE